jgi:uncharacterized protein YcfJ
MICMKSAYTRSLFERVPAVMALALAAGLAGMAHAQVPAAPTSSEAPPAAVPSRALEPMVGVAQAPAVVQAPTLSTARVISVTSVAQPASATRLVCTDAAEVPAPTSGIGAVAGAIVGAAVGSQIGGGNGNALATAAAAVGGALVGDRAEQGGRTQTVRRCVTHSGTGPSVVYQVVYEFAGQPYSTVLPYHPGASVQVQVMPVVSPAVVGAQITPPVPPTAMATPTVPTAPAPGHEGQGVAVVPTMPSAAVMSHTVVVAPPSYGYYGPYGYSAYSPYWGAPVVVGVGAGWGRPHRGWRGHRRW